MPLSATHSLRNAIVDAKSIPFEVLEKYDIPTVASVLKLYLLELPDSLVSSHVYEIIKTIYTTTAPNTTESTRVNVIQSTLGQLRLANIATLDAIITHFARLIELTSADETYVNSLATTIAPCILRPKQESSLSMTEKFNIRLVRDLFAHKDDIFGELKRASSLSQTKPESGRNRAVSTDESRRRENMEERQRALAAGTHQRPRAASPARLSLQGFASMHRRDRSTSAETRFPIATNTGQSVSSPLDRRHNRASLEVPGSPPKTQTAQSLAVPAPQSPPHLNGDTAPTMPRTAGTDDRYRDTNRDRSDTQSTANTAPIMSSSISQPGEFMSPSHYYSSSRDSDGMHPTSHTDAGAGARPPSIIDTSATTTNSAPSSASTTKLPSSAGTDVTSPEKRDSLKRTSLRGGYNRRTTGPLQRQSLIGKRDSIGSTGSSGPSAATNIVTGGDYVNSPVDAVAEGAFDGRSMASAKRGVELVDRPMDD